MLGCGDTGANIGITNESTAQSLRIPMQRWLEPITIECANSTTSVSTHYIDAGPILGRLAIIENAPGTLISIYQLTTNGYSATFTSEKVTITNMSTNKIVYQNTCDHQSRLWYLDIPELIRLGRAQPQGHKNPCAFGGVREEPTRKDRQSTTTKAGRIGQEEVSAILWLHNCLNHSASPTMIANAIRDGAWMGVNTCINKEDVIKVFERNPCVICALAKKNKKPTPEGSGIRAVIGEELSCDYVGEIHPKSVHGNTGAYIFTDSATGMEHVYPVRSKTELLQCAKKTIEYYSSHRHITRKIRCDAGSSENAAEAKSQLATIHIELRPAAPGKQNQNPVERHIQTTKKGTAATLFGQATLHAGWCICES